MGKKPFDVQYWLVSLNEHGNPSLEDGPHSERDGADKALYLLGRLGLARDAKYAIARVELTEPDNKKHAVNEEACNVVGAVVRAYKSTPSRQTRGGMMLDSFIYLNGLAHGRAGVSWQDNPHQPGTTDRFEWARGWRDGTKDRNSPCPCGSGKKYKRCCGRKGVQS
jgi:ribosome modulation factor